MKKILKVILFNIALFMVLQMVLEIILRMSGVETLFEIEKSRPGWKDKYAKFLDRPETEEIIVHNSFYTDGEGIFRANPEYYKTLKKNNQENLKVNQDGFRGNPFAYTETARTKLLLIGDSFTWGNSAKPITLCFADLLEQAGYHIYNGGIPGTDPQQYALIAKKYIPLLKPDAVAVCLYLGNDVSNRPLLIQPNKNLHYITDSGFILGFDDQGNFFRDSGEAIWYLNARKCGRCKDPWSYFLFRTVTGRSVYTLLNFRQKIVRDPSRTWVIKALEEIEEVCLSNNCRMLLFIIPFANADSQKKQSLEYNKTLLKHFQYYYPEHILKKDYVCTQDKHFNNSGHQKYAEFMLGVLKQNGFFPNRSDALQ